MGDYKEQKLKPGVAGIPSNITTYEVVEHRIGNQTDAEDNHNKFFSLELIRVGSDYYCYTNYGRVSTEEYTGAAGLYGPDSESEMRTFFERKFKEKVRPSKGYKEITFIKAKVGSPKARLKTYAVAENDIPEEKKKKILEENQKASDNTSTASKPKIDIHPTVARLVNQWYSESSSAIQNNAAVTISKDGLETPLGVLTFRQIETGRKVLGELGEAVKSDDKKEIKKLTGNFYSFIPTKLSHKIGDADLISTDALIQQKLDLLGMMEDALEIGGSNYVSDVEQKYLSLGTKFVYLDKNDSEWIRIAAGIKKTRGNSHYGTTDKVLNVIKIELNADRGRYETCKVDNIKELYHGSRNCNLCGILKSGMKIAPKEAPRSGLAFGRGIYYAHHSTKSINYSLYPFPGVEKSKNCFLFLFSVKLGKQLVKSWGNGNEDHEAKKGGFDSTWGKSGNGGLQFDEYIVYDEAQARAEYLVELER